MKKRLQNGFAHPGIILILLVILAVALIGFKVVRTHNKAIVSTAGSGTTVTQTAQDSQAIKTSADLNTAENSLNSQNIDGDLNPGGYNQDVNSLL